MLLPQYFDFITSHLAYSEESVMWSFHRKNKILIFNNIANVKFAGQHEKNSVFHIDFKK